jgi:hypothetical protein
MLITIWKKKNQKKRQCGYVMKDDHGYETNGVRYSIKPYIDVMLKVIKIIWWLKLMNLRIKWQKYQGFVSCNFATC